MSVVLAPAYRLWLNGGRINDDELQGEPANYAVRIPYWLALDARSPMD